MSKRTRNSRNCKKAAAAVVVKAGDAVFIGLDVHRKTISAAMRVNGVEVRTWVMPASTQTVVATLLKYKPAIKKVVYEAGPTGYGLARALRAAGIPCDVVAPGKTPRQPNPGSKTDRLDCRKLAEYAEKGLLNAVTIPTPQEEIDRQVTRLRDMVMRKKRRVKQQIKSFLLMYGIPEPEGLKHWSLAGLEALKNLELPAGLRFTLDAHLAELEYHEQTCRKVEKEIRTMSKEKRYRHKQELLCTHPGVGVLTAMNYLTEVYQPDRFSSTQQVSAYTGLAPRITSSGETHRGGPLIKAGRGPLRALLVEDSWTWIRRDPAARETFNGLVRNTGNKQKAIVGMARHMAGNLWCMLTRGEPYAARAVKAKR